MTNFATWASGRGQFYATRHTGDTHYIASLAPVDELLSLTAGTVVVIQRKQDTTLRASSAFGNTAVAGAKKVNAHTPYSDGTVYWDWAGNSAGASRVSVAGLSFDTRWQFWTFTVGGGFGMRIYRNGQQVASNAGTPTRTADAANVLDINRSVGSSTNGDFADYQELKTYNRALSPSEVWHLYEDYLQDHPVTLRRFSRRVYSFGTVAAAGGNRRRRVLLCGSR